MCLSKINFLIRGSDQRYDAAQIADSSLSPRPREGNKIGLPTMKGEKLKTIKHKWGLGGCIWSSLIAPGTGLPLCHPIWGSVMANGTSPRFAARRQRFHHSD